MANGGWGEGAMALGPGPWALAWARPSVDMNWPWSDLLTDVVLTSVGGWGLRVVARGGVGGGASMSERRCLRRVEILKN